MRTKKSNQFRTPDTYTDTIKSTSKWWSLSQCAFIFIKPYSELGIPTAVEWDYQIAEAIQLVARCKIRLTAVFSEDIGAQRAGILGRARLARGAHGRASWATLLGLLRPHCAAELDPSADTITLTVTRQRLPVTLLIASAADRTNHRRLSRMFYNVRMNHLLQSLLAAEASPFYKYKNNGRHYVGSFFSISVDSVAVIIS